MKNVKKVFNEFLVKGRLKKAKTFLKKKEMLLGYLLLKQYYIKLGKEYLLRRDYKNALECYNLRRNPKMVKRLIHVRTGNEYVLNGEYKKALNSFTKSGFLNKIAWCYGIMADDYKKKGENILAKLFFKKGIKKYESLLKSFDYFWNDEDNKDRTRCMIGLKSFEKSLKEKKQANNLRQILKGVGNYCAQLKAASIYFYCKEYINEIRYYSDGVSKARFEDDTGFSKKRKRGWKKSYSCIYSYQLIQNGDLIKETRKILQNSGSGKGSTTSVLFSKIIFGPLGILDFSWQPYFDYKIIGEETINQKKAIILECIPENPFRKENNGINNLLFGKVWVSADDFTVLKIAWEPKSVAFAIDLIKNNLNPLSKLNFKYTVDFFFKRNGIRYPTKSYYSEYFVNKKGKKSTLLALDVKYSDFRFFNVETTSEHTIGDIE